VQNREDKDLIGLSEKYLNKVFDKLTLTIPMKVTIVAPHNHVHHYITSSGLSILTTLWNTKHRKHPFTPLPHHAKHTHRGLETML
jgi:hypothetical protein